jgi:hypothetical protein
MSRPLRLWLALFPAGALLSGALWRGEIAWHGWAGLAWLGWFHWAVPAGLALFLASALLVVRAAAPELRRGQLAGVAVVLAAFAVAGHRLTQVVLFTVHARGMYLLGSGGEMPVMFALVLALALLPLTLAALLAMLQRFPGWARLAGAFALWIAAVPVACVTCDTGDVEAIKRGWPVPILYVALGLLFLPRGEGEAR